MTTPEHVRTVLDWHILAGVDETVSDTPVDRFSAAEPVPHIPAPAPPQPSAMADSQRARPPSPPTAPPPSGDVAVKTAVELAGNASNLEDLRAALSEFEGCALKKTATNLVFTDGNPDARLLLIGEAPGAEEDRQGLPFVGPSGRLLDRMLASIGMERADVLISNTVYWRPPGNRTPTPQETAICMPFVERLIALVMPDVLVPMGGPAAKSLLNQTLGIGKLRGNWYSYSAPSLPAPIDATPMFHPAYLLRTPAQKRATWRDLLMIKRRLSERQR